MRFLISLFPLFLHNCVFDIESLGLDDKVQILRPKNQRNQTIIRDIDLIRIFVLSLGLQFVDFIYYIGIIPWIISRNALSVQWFQSKIVDYLILLVIGLPTIFVCYVMTSSILEINQIFYFSLVLLYDLVIKETMAVEDKLH